MLAILASDEFLPIRQSTTSHPFLPTYLCTYLPHLDRHRIDPALHTYSMDGAMLYDALWSTAVDLSIT